MRMSISYCGFFWTIELEEIVLLEGLGLGKMGPIPPKLLEEREMRLSAGFPRLLCRDYFHGAVGVFNEHQCNAINLVPFCCPTQPDAFLALGPDTSTGRSEPRLGVGHYSHHCRVRLPAWTPTLLQK